MEIKGNRLISEWVRKYRQNITLGRAFSVLSIDILVRLSNVILLPIYLRLMTQDEYGKYNYILSLIANFSLILNFGLFASQSKYYADAPTAHQKKIVLLIYLFTHGFTGAYSCSCIPVQGRLQPDKSVV